MAIRKINQLNTVPSKGVFGDTVATVNTNFELLFSDLALIFNASIKCKGSYSSYEALAAAWESPEVGDWGCVINGDTMDLYICEVEGSWQNEGQYSGTLVEFENYLTQSDKFELCQKIDKVELNAQTAVDAEAQARDAAILQERTRALMAEQSIKSLLNASIDYAALPTMSYKDIACYGHPTRHAVTKTTNGKTYVIGILDTIATGDGNVITQTLKTRCKLDGNGNLDTTKFEAEVQVYERSYLVNLVDWYEESRITDNGITIDTNTYTKEEVNEKLLELQNTISGALNNKADKADLNMGISQQVTELKDAIIADVKAANDDYKGDITKKLNKMQTAIDGKTTYDTISDNFVSKYEQTTNEEKIKAALSDTTEYVIGKLADTKKYVDDNTLKPSVAEATYLNKETASQTYAAKTEVFKKEETFSQQEVNDLLNAKADKNDLSFYYTKLEVQQGFVAKETNDHGSASDEEQKP